jgi:hypothetical protein
MNTIQIFFYLSKFTTQTSHLIAPYIFSLMSTSLFYSGYLLISLKNYNMENSTIKQNCKTILTRALSHFYAEPILVIYI